MACLLLRIFDLQETAKDLKDEPTAAVLPVPTGEVGLCFFVWEHILVLRQMIFEC